MLVPYIARKNLHQGSVQNFVTNTRNGGVSTSPLTIGVRYLSNSNSTTDTTNFSTGSCDPAANALLILMVSVEKSGGLVAPASFSGLGVTWTQYDSTSISTRGMWAYHALTGGSAPTPDVVTATFGLAQASCSLSVVEFTNTDISGTNGSGALLQDDRFTGGARTTSPISLPSAISHPNNVTYIYSWNGNSSPRTCSCADFTELWEGPHSTPQPSQDAGYWATNTQAGTPTWSASGTVVALGVEIKARNT